MKFSLLDFNTQGTPFYSPDLTLRYKKFSELIATEDPDIICFQEVSTYYHLFLLKKHLKYPFFLYEKFFHGPKGGLVIASKIALEKVAFKKFVTLGSLKDISFWSQVVQNGMLICKCKDRPLFIINTHTFSDFEFEWSPTNHLYRFVKSHIEQIVTEINSLTLQGNKLIVAGDFNMKKNSRLYKYILEQTKALDVFKKDSFPTYYRERLNYKFKGKTSERIDFIFLNNIKATQILTTAHVLDKQVKLANKKLSYLSDHIGLKVNFDIV